MNFIEQQNKGAEFLAALNQRAWESPEFKNLLLTDPKAAIEQATGKDLSSLDREIIVTDQSDPNAIYININAQPSIDEMELTEEQLELVAGGGTPFYVLGAAVGIGVCYLVDKYVIN